MKRFLLFLLILVRITSYAQFHDDFSDGDFQQNPRWEGTTEKFRVNAANQLQLQDEAAITGSNKAYLATSSQAILAAEWSCAFSLNVILTSANYVRFYLISDTLNLSSSLNGYFVMLGGVSKEVALYRQNGTVLTKLIDGIDNRFPSVAGYSVNVKITRDSVGAWELWSKLATDSEFVLEGTCRDKTLLKASYSGLFFNYSITNKTNFACDSIRVTGNPYVKHQQNVVKNDLVFTEIMADPDPPIALPNAEYVEIFNRTDHVIDLAGWKFCLADKCGTILEGALLPHTYAILCTTNKVAEFKLFGNTIGVSSCPSILNSGGVISLISDEDKLVAWTDFSDSWYGDDAFKQSGGWSLERINVDYLDNYKANWLPSNHPIGGTPGVVNSVAAAIPDTRVPTLNYLAVLAPDTLLLQFSKSMDEQALSNMANYQTENLNIQSVITIQPFANTVLLVLADALESDVESLVHLTHLKCVDGLLLEPLSLRVALPQTPSVGDVVINEILFNPTFDGVDYVEILNVSDHVLDLSQLYMTKRKGEFLDVRTSIVARQALCFPGDYWVLTSDPVVVSNQFSSPTNSHFAKVALPSMNDDAGSVVLILHDGTVMDEFSYSEKMHHPFVVNREGVALERVSPFLPTQLADNWQSASFEVGYGTPGYQNSQYLVAELDVKAANFVLEKETFTPDNDGYLDLLQLNYKLPEDGFTAYIDVYDANGLRLRRILNGELLGTEGVIFWNGLSDKGTLCNVGVYVLFVEAIHPGGNRIQKKIVCVLSAR